MDLLIGDNINPKRYGQVSMAAKKAVLLIDNMKNPMAQLKACKGIKPADVKHIMSQSADMISLIIQMNK